MASAVIRTVGWVVAAAAVGGGAYAWTMRPREAETVEATRKDVVESAVASGRVVAPAMIQVGVVTGGTVADVKVVEGQHVKAGELLLRLDDRSEVAAVVQARAAVAQARARLLEVTELQRARAAANVAAADADLARAAQLLARARKLQSEGAAAAVDVEGAESAEQLARARREGAVAEARATDEGGALVKVAESQVQVALAAQQAAEVRVAQARVTAPAEATVLRRSVEPGDAVFPGRTLLVLGRSEGEKGGRMEIIAEPDERSLAVLRVGLVAACAADAFPDKPFDAVVKDISPLVDAARGTVEVRLSVTEPPPFLRADMTVSVEVTTGRKENALVLPSDVVRDLATREPWVLVLDGETAARRPVRIGARGTDVVEILSGVDEGTRVIRDTKLKPGARVKQP